MISIADLVSSVVSKRRTYAFPGFAVPVSMEYTPMDRNNPAFLEYAMRREVERKDTGDTPAALAGRIEFASVVVESCAPTLVVDGADRTADVRAFLVELATRAPGAFADMLGAVQSQRDDLDVEAVAGN